MKLQLLYHWNTIQCLTITRQQILDSSKLKEFADDNFKFDENGRKLSKRVENTVGKGDIAHCEQFLLSHSVLKSTVSQRRQKVSLCGIRLNNLERGAFQNLYGKCNRGPLLQAWLLPDLNTIPNTCIVENSIYLSGYGIGFHPGVPSSNPTRILYFCHAFICLFLC